MPSLIQASKVASNSTVVLCYSVKALQYLMQTVEILCFRCKTFLSKIFHSIIFKLVAKSASYIDLRLSLPPSLLCDEGGKFKTRGLSNNIGNWSKWAWPCCRQEGGLARTVKRLCWSTDPPLPHQAHHPWAFQPIFGQAPFFLTSDHLTFFTVQLLYPCIFLTATRPLALGSWQLP